MKQRDREFLIIKKQGYTAHGVVLCVMQDKKKQNLLTSSAICSILRVLSSDCGRKHRVLENNETHEKDDFKLTDEERLNKEEQKLIWSAINPQISLWSEGLVHFCLCPP